MGISLYLKIFLPFHQSRNRVSTGFIRWLNQSSIAASSCQPGLWVHQERAASGHKQSSYVLPGSF